LAGADFAEVEIDSVRQWDSPEVTRMVTAHLERCHAAAAPELEPVEAEWLVPDFSPRGGNSPRHDSERPRHEAIRRITSVPRAHNSRR
jgi:hypothetical protein